MMMALVAFSLVSISANAQDSTGKRMHKHMKNRMDNLTPAQKEEMKLKMKERQKNLTPEERDARKEKAKERYNNLSPEQQAKIKERMKNRGDSTSNFKRKAWRNKRANSFSNN